MLSLNTGFCDSNTKASIFSTEVSITMQNLWFSFGWLSLNSPGWLIRKSVAQYCGQMQQVFILYVVMLPLKHLGGVQNFW